MNSIKNIKLNFFLYTLLLIFTACSTKPVVQDLPPSAIPGDEIAQLDQGLKKARQDQIDILSPGNFYEANRALEDAKNAYSKGRDSSVILKKVATGNTYLKAAMSSSETARQNTDDVLNARRAALEANAENQFPKEFSNADRELTDLTKQIEKNKFKKVTTIRPELLGKYLALEIKAIKENNLKESKTIIEMAKKEGARKFAPRTLATAEKSVIDTENYITAYRHNSMGIRKRAMETKEAADNLLRINRIAKGTDHVSPEEVALSLEKEKMKVAMKQSQLAVVEEELQTTQSALDRDQDTINALKKSKEELIALKKQDEKFELASQMFSPEEAEVYKKGNSLLIRLKGMEFPVAESTIQTKSYPLLSKVQKIIGEFGKNSSVMVEGHTDSLGDKKMNNRLSTERAQAVIEYLKSSSEETPVQLEARGFGDEKPIAGNKTASGRAKNRRVDVIIQPL